MLQDLHGKIRHHLSVIRERLHVLQPENERPQVTQSDTWKGHITAIRTLCSEIQDLVQRAESNAAVRCNVCSSDGQGETMEEESEQQAAGATGAKETFLKVSGWQERQRDNGCICKCNGCMSRAPVHVNLAQFRSTSTNTKM